MISNDELTRWIWAYNAGRDMAASHGHDDGIGAFQIADRICATWGWPNGRDLDVHDPARRIWKMAVEGAMSHYFPK